MNRRAFLFSIVGWMLLTCKTGYGVGSGQPKTASGTDSSTFVTPSGTDAPTANRDAALQPPIQKDEPAENSSALNFDTESEEHPLGRGTPGLALLAGGGFEHLGTSWDPGATVAARYYFSRSFAESEGPESLSPWSVELGADLIPSLSGNPGGESDVVAGNSAYGVQVSKLYSEHVALQYRFSMRRPVRMTPDVSLGIAVAQISNDFTATNPFFNIIGQADRTSIGPYARIGLSLLSNDWFALRTELGYTHFSETLNNGNGQSFKLTLSGIGVYPSIQVSLGYLQPGVEKAVYLPPSALPLWAIAALQTERRSPIIAPPEVLLNAHQAAATGGLSGNILFQYKNRTAQKVELLADFNHWKPEPMYLDSAHVWVTVKDLKAGPYHYVYLINGKREVRDPWNTSFDPSQRAHGCSVFVVPEVSPTVE